MVSSSSSRHIWPVFDVDVDLKITKTLNQYPITTTQLIDSPSKLIAKTVLQWGRFRNFDSAVSPSPTHHLTTPQK